MPPIRLMLTALSLLLLSVWGVLLVLEKTVDWQFYLFLFGVIVATPIVFKAVWDSWRDIQELRTKASKGDRDSMYWLAMALRETDMDGAIHWAEQGAALGDVDSNFLAGYLRYGRGIRDQQTFDYFLVAAEKGDEPAMRAVADCYKRGDCVLPNDRLSFEWRFKSASSADAYSEFKYESEFLKEDRRQPPGHVCSQYAVGISYLKGDGCEKNEVKGYAWLLLAARAGYADALKRVRELDRRKAYKLRALMQEKALEIRNSLEYGGVVEPDFVSPTGDGKSVSYSQWEPASASDTHVDSQPEPVSAWRSFFTVFLAGNMLCSVLFFASKGERASVLPQEVYALLHFGFIAAALVAAFYGRKLTPLFHFLLLFAISVGASAVFAYWGRPMLVGYAIGASLAGGAIVLPLSIILMHWRHAVADYLFYGLIASHGIGLIMTLI